MVLELKGEDREKYIREKAIKRVEKKLMERFGLRYER